MKRLLLLGVGSALMFTMGGVGPASADAGPHRTTAVAGGGTALISVAGGTRCASCHRAHTAKAENLLKAAEPALCYSCHGSLGSGVDVIDGVQTESSTSISTPLRGGGFEYALINGAGASKTMGTVLGAHGYPVASEFVPVLDIDTAIPATMKVTSRHEIDGTKTGTMWGNGAISDSVNPGATLDKDGAAIKLECTSCHDPHGNGNFRILKPVPAQAGVAQTVLTPAQAYVPAVMSTTTPATVVTAAKPYVPATYAKVGEAGYVAGGINGVNIPDATGSKVYTTTDYWKVRDLSVPSTKTGLLPVLGTGLVPNDATTANSNDSTDGNLYLVGKGPEQDGFIGNIAAWCTTCHTRYLAGSGSYKTDSKDAVFTYRHRSDSTDKEGVSRPNCIQCHVSHGSNAAMTSKSAAVPFPAQVGSNTDGTLTSTDPGYGDSKLLRVNNRGTCVMCHNI